MKKGREKEKSGFWGKNEKRYIFCITKKYLQFHQVSNDNNVLTTFRSRVEQWQLNTADSFRHTQKKAELLFFSSQQTATIIS